jgi:N-acetylmuramoyl-L-alanine amidase
VLGAAYGGETLPIVGRTADSTWYQVETRYGTGWVSASFVVTRNEYGGTPVTTGTVTAETPVTGPIGIINTGALNIRSGPGVQYSSIGTLAGGTQTRIVGRTADWSWWLLDTPVGTGWANAIYIIVRGDTSSVPYVPPGSSAAASPGAPEATAPEAVVSGPVAFVATGALNIRSGPNSTFPSLGSVTAGTRMPIIGQSPDRGWWYVESPYGNGYVSKLYVIAEGNTSGVPVVQ